LQALENEQEVIGVLSDLVMEAYAMESTLLRARKKLAASAPEACAAELAATSAYVYDAIERIEVEARRALARIAEGDTLRTHLASQRHPNNLSFANAETEVL